MRFIDLVTVKAIHSLPCCRMRTPFGERIMLSYLEMESGAEVPLHAHPHEQAGMLLKGKLQLTIGEETRIVEPGNLYMVPGGVPNRAVAIDGPVVVLYIFSPIREDYAQRANDFVPQPGDVT